MSLFQAGPAVEELPPPPPPPAEPPVESAWERGLRHAKEVLTCAFPQGFFIQILVTGYRFVSSCTLPGPKKGPGF